MNGIINFTIIFIALFLTFNVCNIKSANNDGPKYKILVLTPLGSKSHKNYFMGIVRALASKGHEVTIVSTMKESKEIQNVRDVVINGSNFGEALVDPFKSGSMTMILDLMFTFPMKCTTNLGANEVQDLKKEKFDFVILSLMISECFISLVHHFKVPYAFASTITLNGGMHLVTGNIYFDSLAPNKFLSSRFPASFAERLYSTIFTLILDKMYYWITMNRMIRYCRQADLCPQDMPHYLEIAENNSLVIMNSVRALEKPAQPWMPHIIHAGGIHCRPAKKLSKELEDWIEDSGEEGFIFFSLGSSIFPSNMPEEYRKILVKTFASLKLKVLWKWDQEMEDMPSNVKISKWFPQQDILGHPKVRLFITHGGLLSTQEATYHNCPILGLPLFADQYNNIQHAVNEGWGSTISWSDLTEDLLKQKIVSVIESTEIKDITEQRSNLMKDRLNQPADEVVYWVEYVIRHNGAEHMKSPIPKLYWFQLYNADVWMTLLTISIIALFLSFKIFKYLIFGHFRIKNKKD